MENFVPKNILLYYGDIIDNFNGPHTIVYCYNIDTSSLINDTILVARSSRQIQTYTDLSHLDNRKLTNKFKHTDTRAVLQSAKPIK